MEFPAAVVWVTEDGGGVGGGGGGSGPEAITILIPCSGATYWWGGRLSPQLPLSRPNRTDARWTVQKRTRPTFARQSPQLLCLYDCPSLLFARTSRFLDLYSHFYGDLSIHARASMQNLNPS